MVVARPAGFGILPYVPTRPHPPEITWATFGGVESPMGLQHYESQLLGAICAIDGVAWSFRTQRIGSLSAPGQIDTRIPTRLLQLDSSLVARALGRLTFGRQRFVHRFDLRLPPAGGPEVVTVHDLPPLRFADEGHLARWSIRSAGRARLVICPSEFAAEEIRSLLPVTSVMTIPNGVGAEFRDAIPFSFDELRGYGVRPPFVLHAGGASRRKNLAGLAGAWRSVSARLTEHQLVLVGPPDPRRDAHFAGADRVRSLGYREPATVARLMASAAAVVVPSTYEGFGLPALEGMAAGTPVVAADAGALPEVCGDAAVLVSPQPDEIAEGLVTVLTDADLRRTLVARGRDRSRAFTWARSAEAHLAAYETAFG
jgi:glycosyltransferase involved in cell wall biosynthesis